MKELLVALFGTYEPVVYYLEDGTEIIPSGLSGVDWPYILGIGLFMLVLYCSFRLIGGLFKR